MREYLYFDRRRLQAYADQIADPTVFDAAREWNAGLSFSGPKVEASRKTVARQRTEHELFSLVEEHLRDSFALGPKGPSDRGLGVPPFYKESFNAYRGSLAWNDVILNFWLHIRGEEQITEELSSVVLLIEDSPSPDGRIKAYTGLTSLVLIAQELDMSKNRGKGNKSSGSLIERFRVLRESEAELLKSPLRFLERAGAQFTNIRTISTLYRLRGVAHVSRDNDLPATRVGYPLAVWE